MRKSLLRFFGIVLTILIGLAVIIFVIVDKPLPTGTFGQEAEQYADEMLKAVNKDAFDSLSYIEFIFRGENHHKWNRDENLVEVSWEEHTIFLDLNRPVDSFNLLELKAYGHFINDSFWLCAPFKVRDDGVIRSTLEVDDGRGLLITYSSGGLTPGDSYLWILDENGLPKAWRLWTSNIPIGGLEFSWENWNEYESAMLSSSHKGKITDVELEIISVR